MLTDRIDSILTLLRLSIVLTILTIDIILNGPLLMFLGRNITLNPLIGHIKIRTGLATQVPNRLIIPLITILPLPLIITGNILSRHILLMLIDVDWLDVSLVLVGL